jgi:hypothetical protein
VEGLEDEAHAAAAQPGGGIVVETGDRRAIDHHLAAVGRIQTGDQVQQGRLADPGFPHHGDEFAGCETVREVRQHGAAAIGFGEVDEFKHSPLL